MKIIILINCFLLFTLGSATGQTFDKIYKESCGYRKVEKDGKFGYINKNNKVVIPIVHQGGYAYSCKYKIIGVSKDYKRGYVNAKNKVVIPLEHDFVNEISSFGTIVVQIDDKYGVYDYKGNLITKIEYDLIKVPSSNGKMYFEKNGKSGYLDKNGKEPNSKKEVIVKKNKYDKIYADVGGYRGVKKDGKFGFIDKNNKLVIPIEYEQTDSYDEKYKLFRVNKNKKWGFINAKNEQIIPIKYDYVSEMSKNGYFKAKNNNKYGTISPTNKIIIPIKYDKISWYNKELDYTICELNGKFGMYDGKGKELLAVNNDEIKKESKASIVYFIIEKKGKYALFVRDKGLLTGFDFKYIRTITTGRNKFDYVGLKSQMEHFRISKKGKYEKLTGHTYLEKDYSEFYRDKRLAKKIAQKKIDAKIKLEKQIALAAEKFTKFKKGDKWGFKNSAGKVVIKALYTEVSDFKAKKNSKNLFYSICKRRGKYGMIDKKGFEILAFNYDEVTIPYWGVSLVKKNNKYGYVYTGEEKTRFLTEIRYNKAEPFTKDSYDVKSGNDLARVEIDFRFANRIGYVNLEGKEIIPAIYDEIGKPDKYGYAIAKVKANKSRNGGLDKLWGIIHKSGDQSKGTKMVLRSATYYTNGTFSYSMKSSGKSGTIISHGGKKLVSKAKPSFSEMNSYKDNYIIVYNNTSRTRYVHMKHREEDNSFSSHDLRPNEVVLFKCQSWRDIYVSKSGVVSNKRKAVDTDYKSACGTIVKMTDYYPELKNTNYYTGGYLK